VADSEVQPVDVGCNMKDKGGRFNIWWNMGRRDSRHCWDLSLPQRLNLERN